MEILPRVERDWDFRDEIASAKFPAGNLLYSGDCFSYSFTALGFIKRKILFTLMDMLMEWFVLIIIL